MKALVKIIVGLCLSHFALAQEISHVNFTSEQGLPSNTVYDVYQAKDGFIWLATENGVCRFNGYSFKTFLNSKSRSHAVSNLNEDKYGRIWVNNFFGQILYIEDDSLKIFEPWEEKFQSGFPKIQIRNDSLLIAQNSEAFIFNLTTHSWDTIAKIPAHLILNKEIGELWYRILNKKGTSSLHELISGKRFEYEGEFGGDQIIFDGENYLFFDSYEKRILKSGSQQNLVKFEENITEEIAKARNIKPIFDHYLALYGIDGLTLFNQKTNEKQNLLKGKNISDVESLEEGGLLISTLNEGVFYIPNLNAKIIKHSSAVFRKLAFINDSELVAVGDFSGNISFFNVEGGFSYKIETDTIREVQAFKYIMERKSLYYESNKLHQFDFQDKNYRKIKNGFPLKDIILYKKRLIGAGTGGVIMVDEDKGDPDLVLPSERMTSIENYQNKIWTGGQNGLFSLEIENEGFTEPIPFDELEKTGVYAIEVISDLLIVGSSTRGLFIIKDNKLIKHFHSEAGLPSNQITCLFADNDQLWIGTDKGVFNLDINDFSIRKYDVKNGLILNDVYDLITVGEKLWVSSNKGVFIVPIDQNGNEKSPELILDHLLIDGEQFEEESEKITLHPNQKQIEFHFDASYALNELGNTSIFYRIKELNTKWNKTNLKNAVASYLSLSPGNYTFQVYAENKEKLRSDVLTRIINVKAPFYKKYWFIILTTIGVCGLFGYVLYHRFKLNHEKNQALLLGKTKAQELRISQLTSIRAQINPHFIFNTMTLIQGKVISGLEKEAGKIIQDFSKLMRLVLDYSQEEFIGLDTEIEVVEKYLVIEKERSDNQLSYDIFVSPVLEVEMLQVPSLISQPFVENAIKHGLMHKKGSKHLGISFYEEDEFLIINIKDNGIGRKASQSLSKDRYGKHQSFATKAFEERIVLINESYNFGIQIDIEDLYDERKNGIGTSVNIKIPLENALRK